MRSSSYIRQLADPERLRSVYMDLPPELGAPAPGNALVTEGVRGIGSAYLICTVREVHRRRPCAQARFQMGVVLAPGIENVGLKTWRLRWYKRTKN